jgi:Protein of unknown function (DUF2628)
MNKYKVYKHPIGDMEAVKQGWSWPAFFLSPFWAMYKKMWVLGVSILMITVFIYSTLGTRASFFSFADVISIFISMFFGMNGNEWRIKSLLTRGYDYIETVNASSPEGAIAVHLKNEADPSAEKEPFL